MTSTKVVWLASYPKSGNTWFRAVVSAYVDDGPVDLETLRGHGLVPRAMIDSLAGVDLADAPPSVQLRLSAALCRAHVDASTADTLWIKTHDRGDPFDGERLHPLDVTRCAICFVRDPRDVVASYANHMAITLDAAIEQLGNPDNVLVPGVLDWRQQRPQPLGTWCDHVRSWLDDDERPTHVVRYEDMHDDPVATAAAALAAAAVDVEPARLDRALAAARFDALAEAEQASGFRERPNNVATFFRSGRRGGWRDELTPSQARRIVDDHGQVMERLGYDTSDA